MLGGIRLSPHVLAATVWVGGQITVAGLVPTARKLREDAPRLVGRAFARLSWPAYAVLLATGIWNVAAASKGQGTAWQVVLTIKVAVAVLAGLAAWLYGRARKAASLALWGAVTAVAPVSALVMGVFLAAQAPESENLARAAVNLPKRAHPQASTPNPTL